MAGSKKQRTFQDGSQSPTGGGGYLQKTPFPGRAKSDVRSHQASNMDGTTSVNGNGFVLRKATHTNPSPAAPGEVHTGKTPVRMNRIEQAEKR